LNEEELANSIGAAKAKLVWKYFNPENV
jgi:hypothetical protein